MTIDLDTLREMLASAERMAALHYWYHNSVRGARRRREAEVLRHVIAYHEGRVYVPGEVAA